MVGHGWLTGLRAVAEISLVMGLLYVPQARAADLLEVFRLARDNDPTLAGEHYQLQASEQSVPEATSALLPVLTANSQVDRTGGDVTYTGSPTSSRQYNSVIWTVQL